MQKSMTEMNMKIILVILFAINSSNCSRNVIDTVEDLVNRHKIMYGDVKGPKWYPRVEKSLKYPRGDKQKLANIANAWCSYYECTAKMVSELTASKRMPSMILTVYEGVTVRLPCGLCIAPGEESKLVWNYAKSPELTFGAVIHDHIVHDEKDIIIYHVEPERAGVYRCEIGRRISGLIILHVVDEEYVVVKPSKSIGPYPTPPISLKDLTIFTSWSSWSECSSCGKVGRRRRYGICYVKRTVETLNQNSSENVQTKHNTDLVEDIRDIFEDYPHGIPCRSVYLPKCIREIAVVKQRRNEIMIAMCKIPCENNTNVANSDSIPLPVRNIQFGVNGEPIEIRCPGTTLRDMPVSWRVGTKAIIPRSLDVASGGRIHLNARDHLVFTELQFSDSNVYSCWQGDRLAGTVKLLVWSGEHTCWNHHTVLLMMVMAAGMLFRYLDRVVTRLLRGTT